MNFPPFDRQRSEACSFSSAKEFRTRSTPLPFVCLCINCSKDVSLELPICESLIVGKCFLINSRFSFVPTVVKMLQP